MAKGSNPKVDLSRVVSRDPQVHSGDLVFTGTRVPVETLVDYLKGGESLDQFLADFPTVKRSQVEAFLDSSSEAIERLQAHDPRAA